MKSPTPLSVTVEKCDDVKNAKILVVDDNPENLEFTSRLLREVDASIIEADTGNEGIDCLQDSAEDYALILMDVNMPGMDGYEAAGLLRSDPKTKDIPIIFMTSQGDGQQVKSGYDHGAVDYLVRPVSVHTLLSKVKVFLELYNRRQEMGALVERLEAEIAERKRLEEEREKREKQILQSQKMESIGTLTGGLAHDFNNIFSSMQGHAELLKGKLKKDHPGYVHINTLVRGLSKASERIKQMLTFSQQDLFDPEVLDIAQVMREALDLLRAMIPTSVFIHREFDPDCGCLCADRSGLFQIVMHLGTNAAEAMEKQRGVFEVQLREIRVDANMVEHQPKLMEGPYIKLTFKDNGCGMDESVLERVFDPFFTTKRSENSSGLGLSVVHGIVMEHQGDVEVLSEIGEGTTVNVYLPKGNVESFSDSKESKPIDSEEVSNTGRILLVDDNDMTLEATELVLETLGYEVTSLKDGAAALEKISSFPDFFDLIITDQIMPHMNGVELVEKIREIRKDLPVIMFSGYSDIININNYQEFDVDTFLMKPYSMKEMSSAVEKTLSRFDRKPSK